MIIVDTRIFKRRRNQGRIQGPKTLTFLRNLFNPPPLFWTVGAIFFVFAPKEFKVEIGSREGCWGEPLWNGHVPLILNHASNISVVAEKIIQF